MTTWRHVYTFTKHGEKCTDKIPSISSQKYICCTQNKNAMDKKLRMKKSTLEKTIQSENVIRRIK